MSVKPNLPPSAQPWGREVNEKLRNVRRVRGSSVQAVNGVLNATGQTNQRLDQTNQQVEEVQVLAQTAMSTADGKGTRYDIAVGDPRPEGKEHDTLFEWDPDIRDGVVSFVGSWDPITEDWVAQELSHQTIASLDLGKATVGTLNVNNSVNIEATTTGGGHVRLNGNGLEGLDAANNRKTFIGSDGTLEAEDATIVGTFRNAPAGSSRLEIQRRTGSWAAEQRIQQFYGGETTALPTSFLEFRGGGLYMVGASQSSLSSVEIYGGMAGATAAGSVRIRNSESPPGGTFSEIVVGDNASNIIRITGNVVFDDTATKQSARNSLGLGNTTGPVPVANGGTGVTTAAAERNRLGLGNTTGALPIANGGTGASTAQAARANLGLYNNAVWDTGWVQSGLAIGTYAGWTLGAYSIRRVGSRVTGLVIARYSAAITCNSLGNITDIPAFWMPSNLRSGTGTGGPTLNHVPVQQIGQTQWNGLFNRENGQVLLTHGSYPNETVAANTNLYFYLDYEI